MGATKKKSVSGKKTPNARSRTPKQTISKYKPLAIDVHRGYQKSNNGYMDDFDKNSTDLSESEYDDQNDPYASNKQITSANISGVECAKTQYLAKWLKSCVTSSTPPGTPLKKQPIIITKSRFERSNSFSSVFSGLSLNECDNNTLPFINNKKFICPNRHEQFVAKAKNRAFGSRPTISNNLLTLNKGSINTAHKSNIESSVVGSSKRYHGIQKNIESSTIESSKNFHGKNDQTNMVTNIQSSAIPSSKQDHEKNDQKNIMTNIKSSSIESSRRYQENIASSSIESSKRCLGKNNQVNMMAGKKKMKGNKPTEHIFVIPSSKNSVSSNMSICSQRSAQILSIELQDNDVLISNEIKDKKQVEEVNGIAPTPSCSSVASFEEKSSILSGSSIWRKPESKLKVDNNPFLYTLDANLLGISTSNKLTNESDSSSSIYNVGATYKIAKPIILINNIDRKHNDHNMGLSQYDSQEINENDSNTNVCDTSGLSQDSICSARLRQHFIDRDRLSQDIIASQNVENNCNSQHLIGNYSIKQLNDETVSVGSGRLRRICSEKPQEVRLSKNGACRKKSQQNRQSQNDGGYYSSKSQEIVLLQNEEANNAARNINENVLITDEIGISQDITHFNDEIIRSQDSLWSGRLRLRCSGKLQDLGLSGRSGDHDHHQIINDLIANLNEEDLICSNQDLICSGSLRDIFSGDDQISSNTLSQEIEAITGPGFSTNLLMQDIIPIEKSENIKNWVTYEGDSRQSHEFYDNNQNRVNGTSQISTLVKPLISINPDYQILSDTNVESRNLESENRTYQNSMILSDYDDLNDFQIFTQSKGKSRTLNENLIDPNSNMLETDPKTQFEYSIDTIRKLNNSQVSSSLFTKIPEEIQEEKSQPEKTRKKRNTKSKKDINAISDIAKNINKSNSQKPRQRKLNKVVKNSKLSQECSEISIVDEESDICLSQNSINSSQLSELRRYRKNSQTKPKKFPNLSQSSTSSLFCDLITQKNNSKHSQECPTKLSQSTISSPFSQLSGPNINSQGSQKIPTESLSQSTTSSALYSELNGRNIKSQRSHTKFSDIVKHLSQSSGSKAFNSQKNATNLSQSTTSSDLFSELSGRNINSQRSQKDTMDIAKNLSQSTNSSDLFYEVNGQNINSQKNATKIATNLSQSSKSSALFCEVNGRNINSQRSQKNAKATATNLSQSALLSEVNGQNIGSKRSQRDLTRNLSQSTTLSASLSQLNRRNISRQCSQKNPMEIARNLSQSTTSSGLFSVGKNINCQGLKKNHTQLSQTTDRPHISDLRSNVNSKHSQQTPMQNTTQLSESTFLPLVLSDLRKSNINNKLSQKAPTKNSVYQSQLSELSKSSQKTCMKIKKQLSQSSDSTVLRELRSKHKYNPRIPQENVFNNPTALSQQTCLSAEDILSSDSDGDIALKSTQDSIFNNSLDSQITSLNVDRYNFDENIIELTQAFNDIKGFIKCVYVENMIANRNMNLNDYLGSYRNLTDTKDIEVIHNIKRDLSQTFGATKMLGDAVDSFRADRSLLCETGLRFEECETNIRLGLILKIEHIFRGFNEDSEKNRPLIFKIRNFTRWDNTIFVNDRLLIKPDDKCRFVQIKLNNRGSTNKFKLLVYLLRKVYNLLKMESSATKREIYYQIVKHVKLQQQVNNAIDTICCLLYTAPWHLGILSTSKGLIYGDLKIFFSEDESINCNVRGGSIIPNNLKYLERIESGAAFVLLVEKDAIFQKLLEENLPNKLARRFILITGKGYGDVSTRRFLSLLWKLLSIPIFILVDADPYGIEIMLCYRFGSLNNCFLSKDLAIPSLRWLGVHPSEIDTLNIQHSSLTQKDTNRIKSILKRPYIEEGGKIQKELLAMLQKRKKAEIEGLMACDKMLSISYLPNKLYTKDFI